MKTILVPTDFSACAGYAVDTAMLFAEKFDTQIHLYHCADLPQNWQTLSKVEKDKMAEALQKIKNAQSLLDKIKMDHPEVDIVTEISGGNLLENIQQYVENNGIELVVMGSHGASGKNEFFIGSNTQKAVRTLHRPVLIVKEKLEKLDFKKVVFVSSFNEDERKSFLKFKKMIAPFKPEIHFLAVNTADFFGTPYSVQHAAMRDFMALAAPFDCEKHIVTDFSVDGGARFFSEEIEADLIAISNHHRRPLKRMFVGSNVEALVNHARLPVLTIDY